MSQGTGQPTVGQEFTARWMGKRNAARFNSATLMRDMTAAVDEYVKSRPEISESLIRAIALEAADGNDTFYEEVTIEGHVIRVTARELLRYPGLVSVANRHHLAGPGTWQFLV